MRERKQVISERIMVNGRPIFKKSENLYPPGLKMRRFP
jgi:hypothetical protein